MKGKILHWKLICFSFDSDYFWIRFLWKFGISGRNTKTTRALFSERSGHLVPIFKIGKWSIRKIK